MHLFYEFLSFVPQEKTTSPGEKSMDYKRVFIRSPSIDTNTTEMASDSIFWVTNWLFFCLKINKGIQSQVILEFNMEIIDCT